MFESHPKPRKEEYEPSDEERGVLKELEETATGTAAETAMKAFAQGLATGVYQLKPRSEDPEGAAVTSAMGMLVRTAAELSKGKPPDAQQVMMVFDPPDGPGAGEPMKVLDLALTGVPKDLTVATLMGLATDYALPLPQGLRVVVIVPLKLTDDQRGNAEGHISSMYCYRTLDNQIKLGGLMLKLKKTNGKWVTTHEAETVEPDESGTWAHVLRGLFIVNQAIIPVHSKFRIKKENS
jgi:hypothetical protein